MSTAAPDQQNASVAAAPSDRFTDRIRASFVAGLTAVVVLAAASCLTTVRYSRATGWVTRAHLALDRLYDLRLTASELDRQTAQFVLGQDAALLPTREAAQKRALEDLKALRGLTRDNRLAQQLVDALAPAIQSRIELDNNVVAARRAHGEGVAAEALLSDQVGKSDAASSSLLDQIETAERRLLDAHLAAARRLGWINLVVIVVGCALALVAIASAGSSIVRALATLRASIAEEAEARDHLRRLNETLEERVAERSAAGEQRALKLAHSQDALYRQTLLLQSLLTSMADAVMICDRQLTLVEINPAAVRLVGNGIGGLPMDQWPTRFELLNAGSGRRLARGDWPLARAVRGEEFQATWILRRTGESRWLEGSAAPVRDDNGSILGAAMVFRDITDRQRSAEELRQARDSALESARGHSEFLTRMSHEIRTPLNGIIGMTQLLLDTPLSPDQRDELQTVWASGNLLMKIVDDVLNFSRLTAGKVAVEQAPFDLYEAAESTVEAFAHRAQSQNLELILSIGADVPREAYGDSRALIQVLTNLISNAIKFTASGEVVVEVTRAAVSQLPGAIGFTIRDTGAGIGPEAHERLFDPFSQADGSTGRKYGGSGLGLAIAKQLVETMGGRIQLESELGAGSSFSFTIGLIADPENSLRTLEAPGLDGLRLLLVDGSATVRRVLSERLGAWGITTEAVATGDAALDAIRASIAAHKLFNFILIDSAVSAADGGDLAAALRLELKGARTRIVRMMPAAAIRGGDESDDAAAGSDGWIRKPVKPSALRERLLALVPRSDISTAGAEAGSSRHPAQPQTSLDLQAARVLVIEDNPVNLKLTLMQLKKLGYPATGAHSAREGLDLLAGKGFPIVLMDCEMPEIDGYAATREIRREEQGARRTVLIAMTAHAVEGAREKCLEAGMDDYLAKPVTLETLHAALERWAPSITSESSPAPPVINFDHHESLDPAILAEIRTLSSADEGEALGELVALFLNDLPKRLEKIAAAVRDQDLAAAASLAHSLKSGCASMGAVRLSAMCGQAEVSAREGNGAVLSEVVAQAFAEAAHVRILLETEQQRSAA